MEQTAFVIPPDIVGLINFNQYSAEFEIPYLVEGNSTGTAKVNVSLLWEGDFIKVYSDSAKYAGVSDALTRERYIRVETLVRATTSLNGHSYEDKDDSIKNEDLKNTLRMIYMKFSKDLIIYMYWCYNQLQEAAEQHMKKSTEELKKNFLASLPNLIPDSNLI